MRSEHEPNRSVFSFELNDSSTNNLKAAGRMIQLPSITCCLLVVHTSNHLYDEDINGNGKQVIAIFYWIALLMTVVDQITKLIVRLNMQVGETYPFRQGILQFTYYQNSGAARSTFQGYGRALGVIAVAFILIVIYYRNKQASNRHWMDVGLAFLVAGAAGNGVERLLFGKVTDFLQFGSGQGIMNIADLSINVGLLVIVVQQIVISKRTREKPSN